MAEDLKSKSPAYWNFIGAEIDDEASVDERKQRQKKRKIDFDKGRLGLSGQPTIDDIDADAD